MHLDVTDTGEGRAVVLLHGLTASKRYVVMGSKALERGGHRVIAYDARGHGCSDPGDTYDYPALCADLGRVMDDAGVESAVLAGSSMGAHTIVRFALAHPERVSGMCLITPAYNPDHGPDSERWERLSRGLREGGVEGFVEAYGEPHGPPEFRERGITLLRQRLSAHKHPDAVADALEQVPRSNPFERWSDLSDLDAPCIVIASRDEYDPYHPYEVGQRYASLIPGARLESEEPGKSPLAWQGGQVSALIAELSGQR